MPLVVRPFHTADAAACGAIVGTTPLWHRTGTTADRAVHFLTTAAAAGDTLLVLDDGDVAGFAWIDRRGAFGRSAYLRMIAVAPDRRSSGLGARLLAAFETIAVQEGPDAFLLVSDFNADARRFYERHGYGEVGRIRGYVTPDVDEILMWKRLTAPA
jgi:ribosomal protein S18 acetylase RimI-like enzyme